MKAILHSLMLLGAALFAGMSNMIAESLSQKFGVPVQIGEMNLETNQTIINKLQISNPSQYKLLSHALTCEQIDIHAPGTVFLLKDIVIDEMELNDVYLGFEFDSIKGTSGNWSQIMKNLQKKTDAQPEQTLLIRRLVLNRIKADVVFDDTGKMHHLSQTPRVVLTNISSKEGISMDQLKNSELGKKLKSVFVDENAKKMLENFLQNPASPVEKLVPAPFKGLFNAVPQKFDEEAVST